MWPPFSPRPIRTGTRARSASRWISAGRAAVPSSTMAPPSMPRPGPGQGLVHRAVNGAGPAPDQGDIALHDRLRRIDIVIREPGGIGPLQGRIGRTGQRVAPAEAVPIGDRPADRDDVGFARITVQ